MPRAHLRALRVAILCSAAVTLSLAGGPASAHIRTTLTHNAPTFGTVYGRFFPNPTDSGPFTVTPSTPVSFTQQFPVILFNPPSDANVHCTPPPAPPVTEATRPMVDVIPQPDGSCATMVVAGNGYQAGVGPLFRFEAVFISTVTVAAAGDATFGLLADDGWTLAIGPDAAGRQPTYIAGSHYNVPATGPFTGYPVVGAYNDHEDVTRHTLTVHFPAAGSYPFEMDYTERNGGNLALTFELTVPPEVQATAIAQVQASATTEARATATTAAAVRATSTTEARATGTSAARAIATTVAAVRASATTAAEARATSVAAPSRATAVVAAAHATDTALAQEAHTTTVAPLAATTTVAPLAATATAIAQAHATARASTRATAVARTRATPHPTGMPRGGSPPTLVVAPSTVRPGARARGRGCGFEPGEPLSLALDGAAVDTTPSVLTADTAGCFAATIAVPDTLLRDANTLSAFGARTQRVALATLTGLVPVAARFYFAGAPNTAAARSTLALLNPRPQRAHLRLIFSFSTGVTVVRTLDVAPAARRTVAVAALVPATGVFGLSLTADQPIVAQLTVRRAGQDGDTLLGTTGLGTTWYLAEGYTGLTFHEDVSILNPDAHAAASVQLRLLPAGGRGGRVVPVRVPAHTNLVVDVTRLLPGRALGVIATANRPVVVERTLTFGPHGYGLTMRTGVTVAATSWLFAEGTTVNHFQTFLTILNPNATPARVTARFFGPTGRRLASRVLRLAAHARATLTLNAILTASGVASVVTSDASVVVERPAYFGSPNAARVAGSDVFGRNGVTPRWSFADGDTRDSREFLLLYNPTPRAVPVAVTFYGDTGAPTTRRSVVPAGARSTLDVNRLLPRVAGLHGVVVRALNGAGLVVEQTIFAPDHGALRGTQGLAQ